MSAQILLRWRTAVIKRMRSAKYGVFSFRGECPIHAFLDVFFILRFDLRRQLHQRVSASLRVRRWAMQHVRYEMLQDFRLLCSPSTRIWSSNGRRNLVGFSPGSRTTRSAFSPSDWKRPSWYNGAGLVVRTYCDVHADALQTARQFSTFTALQGCNCFKSHHICVEWRHKNPDLGKLDSCKWNCASRNGSWTGIRLVRVELQYTYCILL